MEYFDRFIPPKGFKFAGVESGIKSKGKDLGLIYSEMPAKSAAVYTTNKMAAAPIKVSIEHQMASMPQAIIVNSGNANSATGKKGLADAYKMASVTAKKLGIEEKSVMVASTGIIGEKLPIAKIEPAINEAVHSLGVNKGYEVAEAIMTTDTVPKEASVQFEIDNQLITVSGIAKGSGMIAPDMHVPQEMPTAVPAGRQATMLAFIVTDLRANRKLLRKVIERAANLTFNSITVDGDTSTNDMCVLLANGTAGNHKVSIDDKNEELVYKAVLKVCSALAKKIVKDAEGATKFITVKVKGAQTEEDAKAIAKSIANSLLIKTAFFGQDANWGRIVAAIGYSGVDIDPLKLGLSLGEIELVKNGLPVKFASKELKEYMKRDELKMTIDLKLKKAETTVWTADLSYDYVKINAEYHT
ncbi:MAG: bifunctional glutamate N-acetyltransferase/amino-acid acetyltransferase ArgJ [Actinobacteria bacterium]|nr:MAG: bifunctional glutamate N-acetyltransferase/amino-acid acetyltransferase ArgJ [Actinomycetota bacterium]